MKKTDVTKYRRLFNIKVLMVHKRENKNSICKMMQFFRSFLLILINFFIEWIRSSDSRTPVMNI